MIKKIKSQSELGRLKRHYRIRKNVSGTKDRPRLSIHRSHKNLYIQLINDIENRTLLTLSTKDKGLKDLCSWGGNKEAAKKMGVYVYNEAAKKGIKTIVFDRSGYLYHGRVKALAESAREAGLKF